MWEIRGDRAVGGRNGLGFTVSLAEPELGLHDIVLPGCPRLAPAVLRIRLPGKSSDAPPRQVLDAYVRGDDLIVRYAVPSEQTQWQIDWRGLAAPTLTLWGGMEVVLSVQTETLDAHPRASAWSQLATSQNPYILMGANLFRLSSGELSYVEMADGADIERIRTTRLDGAEDGFDNKTEFRLGRLEKGVIRRCRIRGYWVPRVGDELAAKSLWNEFQASPLPLTA